MSTTGYALLVLILAGAALMLYLTRNLGQATGQGANPSRGTDPQPGARPGNQLPILSFDALVARTGGAGFIHQIEHRSGFAHENFARDCLPLLKHVAEYVQLFPASEAHHHAQEGGLLIHLLETAAYALHFREGQELPLAAAPEERARLKHRWTYGVLLAALLHDIGKPLADLRISLYGTDPQAGTPWRAFAGAVTEAGATHYAVDFADPTERDYDAHQRLAYALAQGFVPQHVRLWLAEDAALMRELAAYLSGEARAGAIAAIVKRADAESVRHNLRDGPRTRFASARTVPLIERLMAALRRMLVEGGQLPLNKPGAAGWVFRGEIWFVSKRMADAVRDYLIAHEQRSTDAPGIPENNERLFDTWGECGACVVNPETNGAVWTARVEMSGFSQRLTLLRFALEKLYADPNLYPADMEGRIVVQSKHEQSEAEAETAVSDRAATAPHPSPPPRAGEGEGGDTPLANSSPEGAGTVDFAVTERPETAERETEPDGFLDDSDAAAEALVCDAQRPQDPPAAPSAPVAPAAPRTAAALLGAEAKPPSKSKEAALRFFAWIQEGIAAGTIKYNVAEARIHFVPEGMLLVSPGTFRDYAAAFGDVAPAAHNGEPTKDRRGNGIQNAVKRSGLVVPSAKGNYLHRYQVLRGGTPGGLLNCFLMPDPALFFNPVPPPNPLLKRFSPEDAG